MTNIAFPLSFSYRLIYFILLRVIPYGTTQFTMINQCVIGNFKFFTPLVRFVNEKLEGKWIK